jgi:hypothetical protein
MLATVKLEKFSRDILENFYKRKHAKNPTTTAPEKTYPKIVSQGRDSLISTVWTTGAGLGRKLGIELGTLLGITLGLALGSELGLALGSALGLELGLALLLGLALGD